MEAQFQNRDATSTYGILQSQPTMDLDFENPAVMTQRELLVLRAIAIVAASISLTSGLLVGYWFIRMKRSFRHQYVYLYLFHVNMLKITVITIIYKFIYLPE